MRRRHNGVAIPPAGRPAAKIVALRHQLAVLERSIPAPLPFTCSDRALWAFLLRHRMVLVEPVTVVA